MQYVDILDKALLNKLLLRTFDDIFKNGTRKKLSEKERVLLGVTKGTSATLDRGGFVSVMKKLETRQRRILTYSAGFDLPAFAIAQFINTNEDSVLVELAELSKKTNDLVIATKV